MMPSTIRGISELIGVRAAGEPVIITDVNDNDLRGGVGLYIAESAVGQVLYVGSVCRPHQADGVRARLREHFRRPQRRDRWRTITVFPLASITPRQDVRRLEGTVAIWLVPVESQAWPRVSQL